MSMWHHSSIGSTPTYLGSVVVHSNELPQVQETRIHSGEIVTFVVQCEIIKSYITLTCY